MDMPVMAGMKNMAAKNRNTDKRRNTIALNQPKKDFYVINSVISNSDIIPYRCLTDLAA